MVGHSEEFRKLGVNIVALSMSTSETLARYLKENELPFPLLADPTKVAYKAFGLDRTSWGRLLRPSSIWKYLKMVAKGGKVRRIPEGEDALQLGGNFLVSTDGRLLWAYRSVNPMDRPTIETLLQACRG